MSKKAGRTIVMTEMSGIQYMEEFKENIFS